MPEKNLFESTVASLPKSDYRMGVWLAMLGCFTSVERTLRHRFSQVFSASLPRYDVLTALVQFPGGLTMGQLASKLMVSKGNITGVVSRLQNAKYVSQARSSADKRVQLVTVTVAGQRLWEEMHTEYRSVIDELFSQLSQAQTKALTRHLVDAQEQIDGALRRREQA